MSVLFNCEKDRAFLLRLGCTNSEFPGRHLLDLLGKFEKLLPPIIRPLHIQVDSECGKWANL